jgi:hypothetical protein
LAAADAHTQADEPTHSTAASSSLAASPGLPDRSSTPAATEHTDSRPATPVQELGDEFGVVPGPSRRLQREHPFSVAPDPMWNSTREILPDARLAIQAPPPPYVLPPTYTEVVPPGQIETVEQVVHLEPHPVEAIEIEPSTLQPTTLDVRDVSVSSNTIPSLPVTEEEAQDAPSYTFGPSWTFLSSTQAQNPTASEDEDEVDGVDGEDGSEDPNSYIGSQATANTDDAHDVPSHPFDSLAALGAEEAENTTTSENETGEVGSGDENPNVELQESQLSETARGKKRMREEDYPSLEDEKDKSETLEELRGGSCYTASGGCNPSGSGSSSSSRTSRDRDGQPDRKRMKTDTGDSDTRISTDPLEVDESVLIVARMGLFETLTDAESCRQVKKLKEIEKLYRSGRLLL